MSPRGRYTAKPGAGISKENAELVAEEANEILHEGDELTPDLLVKRAKPKRARLHNLFTWDDKEAAEGMRRVEALKFLRSIVEVDVTFHTPVRSFFNVSVETDDGSERKYLPRREVMKSEDHLRQVSGRLDRQVRNAVTEAESLGLQFRDPSWKKNIEVVRRNEVSF